jgi:hypothetical protein
METVNVYGILAIKHVKCWKPGRKIRILKVGVGERGCEVLRWMAWFCTSRIAGRSFY